MYGLKWLVEIFFFFFWTFYFVLGNSQLAVLWVSGKQKRDSGLHRHVSILPQMPLPPREGATWHWAEFCVLYSRSLLVIHFKHSSVNMSIPNSLNCPFPPTLLDYFWLGWVNISTDKPIWLIKMFHVMYSTQYSWCPRLIFFPTDNGSIVQCINIMKNIPICNFLKMERNL